MRNFTRASLIVAGLAILAPSSAPAIGFSLADGELYGSFDTTISLGTIMRVSAQDPALIGIKNGGEAYSINGDNGNLNFTQWEFASALARVGHELEARWGNWSLFGRGYYFYDGQVMDWVDTRTPISEEAKNWVGRRGELLDLYVSLDIEAGDQFLNFKAGNQVINWGESLFIQNGINTMSPIDVGALRLPGSELKDALRALPALDVTWAMTDRFSLEAFTYFDWKQTEIEPEGTFFSTNDFISPGGRSVYLGFGLAGGPTDIDNSLNAGLGAPVGSYVSRSADGEPDWEGQFGVALRWFEPRLNDSELGFYFTNLHSRLPLISAYTGTRAGLDQGNYAASANYFREYPEDIQKLGASINTSIPGGWALGSELSYTIDQPIQIDDVELLFGALNPLDPILGTEFGRSQLIQERGAVGFDEYMPGFNRKDYWQGQVTLTQLFPQKYGTDQIVLIGEFGGMYIVDMEDPDVLRYEGPGTYTSANPWFSENNTPAGSPYQPATAEVDAFADPWSWGYRIATRWEFNNALWGMNLLPAAAFFHDFQGTSPSPVLNFVEGRKSFATSLTAVFLYSWEAKLSYSNSFGGDSYNLSSDRDFVGFSIARSF